MVLSNSCLCLWFTFATLISLISDNNLLTPLHCMVSFINDLSCCYGNKQMLLVTFPVTLLSKGADLSPSGVCQSDLFGKACLCTHSESDDLCVNLSEVHSHVTVPLITGLRVQCRMCTLKWQCLLFRF